MQDFDVMQRIRDLCSARSWTVYRLAKESGITYSTLNTMLHSTNLPSLTTMEKLCHGFGISLAQFFSEADETALLTADQRACLALWNRLDDCGKALATAYMSGLEGRQNPDKH